MTNRKTTIAPLSRRERLFNRLLRKNEPIAPAQPLQIAANATSRALSPWLKAYQKLNEEDPELIQKYERQVNKVLVEGGTGIDPSDKASLDQIIAHGLQHATNAQVRIAGHTVQEGLAKAAEIVEWAKDWIGQAVQTSPEASIVWSIISLGIPFLTYPAAAENECKEGFVYTVGRMDYYTAFEQTILNLGSSVEPGVVTFYKTVLSYQIRCVLRFYRSSTSNFARDVVQLEDWKGMLQELQKAERQLHQDTIQLSTVASQQKLARLAEIAEVNSLKLKSLDDICTRQLEVQKDIRDYASKSFNLQEEISKRNITKAQEDALQLFRLSEKSIDTSYEAHKKQNSVYIEGTCQWFTKHQHFREWMQQDSGPLFITADPGCGKSVLAAYLIDEMRKERSVCYFFFKDQIQNTLPQALCALLHQLFSIQVSLLEHAMPLISSNGQGLVTNNSLLGALFVEVVEAFNGPLTIVVDALDECLQDDRLLLLDILQTYLPRTSAKFLLTSRPYTKITGTFMTLSNEFPHIRIPGEELSDDITSEINIVVKRRINQLGKELSLDAEMEAHMENRLLEVPQRTYLWVHLVLDYLRNGFKKTARGFDQHVKDLPTDVDQAYEKMLLRNGSHSKASASHKILSIMLAAGRALYLIELQLAFELCSNLPVDSHEDIDLERPNDFKETLRRECGLLVVIQDDQVYFLHQTVREFLLSKHKLVPINEEISAKWGGSIHIQQAHTVIARSCISYLHLAEFKSPLEEQGSGNNGDSYDDSNDDIIYNEGRKPLSNRDAWFKDPLYSSSTRARFPFLTYAAKHWNVHFEKGNCNEDNVLVEKATALCTCTEGVFRTLFRARDSKYWIRRWGGYPEVFEKLYVAVCLGSSKLVEILLRIDEPSLGTILESLHAARWHRYISIADMLLRHAMLMDRNDPLYAELLPAAAKLGHRDFVDTVLKHEVTTNSNNIQKKKALYQAV